MKDITSLSELNLLMESVLKELLQKISKDVLKDFKEKYIQKYIYDLNYPNATYKNDGVKFIDVWDFDEPKKLANSMVTEMKGDWTKMKSMDTLFIHSSYSPFGEDSRQDLERYLNKNGGDPYRNSKPYWNIFKTEYVNGGGLKKVVDRNAKALGLENSASVSWN